jgi:DNA polymerase I-like protein with 3'-5' exonuclease and polymerase domains
MSILPNSWVASFLKKLNLPVQKKTKKKTGYSTDVEVLTKLARSHELPALVLRHRTLAKLKSTYADALLDLIHPGNRAYPHLLQPDRGRHRPVEQQ